MRVRFMLRDKQALWAEMSEEVYKTLVKELSERRDCPKLLNFQNRMLINVDHLIAVTNIELGDPEKEDK